MSRHSENLSCKNHDQKVCIKIVFLGLSIKNAKSFSFGVFNKNIDFSTESTKIPTIYDLLFLTHFFYNKSKVDENIEAQICQNLRIIEEYSSGAVFCILKIFGQ